MKKLSFLVSLMTVTVVFFSFFSQNVMAEESETNYLLRQLQPYVDELEAINNEFGIDLVMSLSSSEDIETAYNNYFKMSVDEFRIYILKRCGSVSNADGAIPEAAPIDELIEPYGAVLPETVFQDTQKAYLYNLSNYMAINSTCYKENNTSHYEKIDSFYPVMGEYPGYKPKDNSPYEYIFNNSRTSVTFTFKVYRFIDATTYYSNGNDVTFTLWAGGSDVYIGGEV